MSNNVGHGKIYEQSDWGDEPRFHLRSIIEYATAGLRALVRFTVDTTKSFISTIKKTIDQTINI